VPAIRTSKAANFDGAYAPSGSLPLYFFIALLLLLCFLADVVRVPSVGTHIGELVWEFRVSELRYEFRHSELVWSSISHIEGLLTRDLRMGNFRSNRISNRIRG